MYGFFYKIIMRITHKYNWHYAPPIYPEGDTQLWCKWCGFRQTIKRRSQHNNQCSGRLKADDLLPKTSDEILKGYSDYRRQHRR